MEHIQILKNKGIHNSYILGVELYNDIEHLWENTVTHQYLLLNIINSYSLFETNDKWMNLLYKILNESYVNLNEIFSKSDETSFSIVSAEIINLTEKIRLFSKNEISIDEMLEYVNSTQYINDKFEKIFIENFINFLNSGDISYFKTMVELIAWIGSRYIAFEFVWSEFKNILNANNDIDLSWDTLIEYRNEVWDSARDNVWEFISSNQCNIIRNVIENPFVGNELK